MPGCLNLVVTSRMRRKERLFSDWIVVLPPPKTIGSVLSPLLITFPHCSGHQDCDVSVRAAVHPVSEFTPLLAPLGDRDPMFPAMPMALGIGCSSSSCPFTLPRHACKPTLFRPSLTTKHARDTNIDPRVYYSSAGGNAVWRCTRKQGRPGMDLGWLVQPLFCIRLSATHTQFSPLSILLLVIVSDRTGRIASSLITGWLHAHTSAVHLFFFSPTLCLWLSAGPIGVAAVVFPFG